MMMIDKLLLIILCLLPINAIADSAKHFGNLTVDKVISVYDGDTFRVNIKNLHPLLGDNISIRIAGMDAPEMKDKRYFVQLLAQKAQAELAKRLNASKYIELRHIKRGKYFRIVADVYIDDINVADEFIRLGFAKPYYGSKKEKWSNDAAKKIIDSTNSDESGFFTWLRNWWGKLF